MESERPTYEDFIKWLRGTQAMEPASLPAVMAALKRIEELVKKGVIDGSAVFRDRTDDPQDLIVSGRRTGDDNR